MLFLPHLWKHEGLSERRNNSCKVGLVGAKPEVSPYGVFLNHSSFLSMVTLYMFVNMTILGI